MLGRYGLEIASAWDEKLAAQIDSITEFPGPLANAIDEEASDRHRREVRRLLFYLSKKRRGGAAWHVIYTIFPPDDEGVSVIRVLRIRSALRGPDDP